MKKEIQVIELVLNKSNLLVKQSEVKVCRTNQKLKMIVKCEQSELRGKRISLSTNNKGVRIKNNSALINEHGVCCFDDLRFIGKSGRGIEMDLFFSINDLVIASYTRAIKGNIVNLFILLFQKKVKGFETFLTKKFELDKI